VRTCISTERSAIFYQQGSHLKYNLLTICRYRHSGIDSGADLVIELGLGQSEAGRTQGRRAAKIRSLTVIVAQPHCPGLLAQLTVPTLAEGCARTGELAIFRVSMATLRLEPAARALLPARR